MSIDPTVSALGVIVRDGLGVGIIGLAADCRVMVWNHWMERHSGIKATEILEDDLLKRFPSITKNKQERIILECLEKKVPRLLSPLMHKSLIPLEVVKGENIVSMHQNVRMYPMSKVDGDLAMVILIEDFTDSILHEQEVYRLNHMLRGIRDINQLITRALSQDLLLKGACRILVERAGYVTARIDFAATGDADMTCIAWAEAERKNDDDDANATIRIDPSLTPDIVKKAFKTGELQMVREDGVTDWNRSFGEIAESTSLQHPLSCAAPLVVEKQLIGVLTVCSLNSEMLEDEPLELFKEVVEDIAYAIQGLRERKARKAAEEALSHEKKRLEVTLRSIGDGVIATDVNGRVVLINTVAEKLTGWPQKEAMGQPLKQVFRIIDEKSRQSSANPVDKVLSIGKVVKLDSHTVLVSRDGSEYLLADSGAPIFNSQSKITGVVLVFQDITERVKLEEDMAQAHKLEAVGTLAGGIAHDFNNILSIIIGNCELALDNIPEGNPAWQNFEEIRAASQRAKDVVRQLLSFSRKSGNEKTPMNILPIIKESYRFLRATIPATIDIRLDLPDEDVTIMADATQIHQVIINLCTNAYHAMQNTGGVLDIGVTREDITVDSGGYFSELKPGAYLELAIRDTGDGIDDRIRDRIFEPYYTTKELGHGTGMGLAVVHGIVKSHEGLITLDKNSGKGTVFRVMLPITRDNVDNSVRTCDQLPCGNESILFIDDEPSITKLGQRMLTLLGYHVETETDPIRALDTFNQNPNEYDLIISDMSMPLLPGDQLVQRILVIRPEIPIILCTGFSDKIDETRAKKLGVSKYIEKPFDRETLAQAVRQALDKI